MRNDVEITNVDRQAARNVLSRGDGCYDLAEDFARHRTEAVKPLVEALEQIAETPNAGWMIARNALAALRGVQS